MAIQKPPPERARWPGCSSTSRTTASANAAKYLEAALAEAERTGDRRPSTVCSANARSTKAADRSIDGANRPAYSRGPSRPLRPESQGGTDARRSARQATRRAVLSRPRRAKADIEEAKLAGLRPRARPSPSWHRRGRGDDEEDLDLSATEGGPSPDGEVSVEVVAEDGADASAARLPTEGRPSSTPRRSRSRRPRIFEAISADMIGIDDPVRCTSRRSARSRC